MDECKPLAHGASMRAMDRATLNSLLVQMEATVGRCRLTLSNPR